MKALFKGLSAQETMEQGVVLTCLTEEHLGAYGLFINGEKVLASKDLPWEQVLEQWGEAGTGIITVGEEEFFCERLSSVPHLVLCGAGHVSTAIVSFAKLLNFRVTAMDDRISFVNNALQAGADEGICNKFEDALENFPLSPNNYYVVATRGHRYDKVCLLQILRQHNQYVGIMSSKRRILLLKKDLLEEGIPPEILDEIYSPIGLDIASETPEEIALSVMAEIVSVKNKTRPSFGYPADFLEVYENRVLPFRGALCTIVQRKGSAPRDVGSKMIVREDGQIFNTIGGGCVEAEVRAAALQVIDTGTPTLVDKYMTAEDAAEEGMVCGGMVRVLIQPL